MASLQERLDDFKKSFESGTPPYNAPREAIETIKGDDQFNGVNERGECYANVSK